MKHYKILTGMAILAFLLKTAQGADNICFDAQWKTGENVKKLYDTPLGAVFKFRRRSVPESLKDHKKTPAFYPVRASLASEEKNAKRKYMVISFKSRIFPVSQKLGLQPAKHFTFCSLALSYKQKIDRMYDNFFSKGCTVTSGFISDEPPPPPPKPIIFHKTSKKYNVKIKKKKFTYKTIDRKNQFFKYSNLSGNVSGPQLYNVKAYRFVIPLRKDSLKSYNINGYKFIEDFNLKRSTNLKSAAIYILQPWLKEKRSEAPFQLELSPVKVTLTDDVEFLKALPEPEYEAYPYAEYEDLERRRNINKNPDYIYYRAMRCLSGDFETRNYSAGINLLKKAAAKKHVFAMYQLGVLNYLGYGTAADTRAALRWLNKAIKRNYEKAKSLKALMLRQKLKNKNLLLNARIVNELCKLRRESAYYGETNALHLLELTKNLHPVRLGKSLKNSLFSQNVSMETLRIDYLKNNFEFHPKLLFIVAEHFFPKAPPELVKLNLEQKSRFDKNPYFFKFTMNFKASGWIDKLIALGYSPAMLFKGKLLLDKKRYKPKWSNYAPSLALSLFEKGDALKNSECTLEYLKTKALLGRLTVEDFTPDRHERLLDNMTFYVLKNCAVCPDSPGSEAYMKQDFTTAYNTWKTFPDSTSLFCRAVIDYANYKALPDDIKYTKEKKQLAASIIRMLKRAAVKNSDAQYFLGMLYSRGELVSMDNFTADKYYKLSAESGHYGACLAMIKRLPSDCSSRKQRLKYLKKICEADLPGAWYLAGNFFETLRPDKAMMAWKKAAQLGCIGAYQKLALHCSALNTRQDQQKANDYWKVFAKLDTAKRNQDVNDFYWGPLALPKIRFTRDRLPFNWDCSPEGMAKQTVRKNYEYY
ncbi:SEL1-like repeat protein [Lentisphaerota bacterium]|nr:SEL1-like repeat protein [Lentisphaerota bacterium]